MYRFQFNMIAAILSHNHRDFPSATLASFSFSFSAGHKYTKPIEYYTMFPNGTLYAGVYLTLLY